MTFPTVGVNEVAWIPVDAMREIDRIMVNDLGIVLLQMMENAGRALSIVTQQLVGPKRATLVAGGGGNGGGGMVAARHLHNLGVEVSVHLTSDTDRLTPVASHQLQILERLGVALIERPEFDTDVVVDAMVGYGLRSALSGAASKVAEALTDVDIPIVSLDIPSGVHGDTGETSGPAVAATATVTLCLPKLGLTAPNTGDLYLADISVPPSTVAQVTNGPTPPFHRGRILRIGA